VADLNKKEKSGSHQREVFLFNDILVLTKIFHKKRNSVTYSFRQSYPLTGITLSLFTNNYFEFGLSLKRGETVLLSLNARNEHDRAKFAEDLREAIAESDEMTRIETLSKENRDSGVDVGKIKRYSNSLLDINDQCKFRSESPRTLTS
jgi:IQ motif/SEC7 domain-containing protein